ncbi:hypothetical protein PORY_002423, partial [Pneumocystis oryctolagi]
SKSGVQVKEDCLDAFYNLKHKKLAKYIIFSINKEKTHIVVEKISESSNYQEFIKDLPENDCRYAVYDLEYDLEGEGKRKKYSNELYRYVFSFGMFFLYIDDYMRANMYLLMIKRFLSPDSSPIRSKMLYASSKDALRRALNGISVEIQGTDLSEIAYKTVFEKGLIDIISVQIDYI